MKKALLILFLFLQLIIVFGQTMQTTNGGKGYSGTAGAMRNNPQYIPSGNSNNTSNNNNASNSSENILSDPCYKNLSFTVKNYGYNKDGGFYSWGIKVRNGYSKAVQLKYKLIVGNDNSGYGTLTNFINPNGSYTNDFGTVSAIIVKSNSEQYRIEVSDVCFQGQDCIKNGYADCNGNQRTNTNDKLSSTNTNQTNNSNTSSTQQNDLTEYNRSKAELERKLQEENTRRQQQANQINNQNQQFTNVYNEGVQLGNTGNYSQAAAKYQQAIGLATNDADRQRAQNAYNNMTSANNQAQVINQVGSTLSNAATVIDDAIAQAKAQKKANQLSYNDLDDHELFEAMITDVLIQFKKFGYNPITPLNEIFSKSSFFTKYNSTRIKFKDFDILITWFYHEASGETKTIYLTCYNETISNYFRNNKILNKLSCGKKSKITYIKSTDSKNEYEMMYVDDHIDFTRSCVKNLNELIEKIKEYKLEVEAINKQKENEKLKEIADAQKEITDAGVEIPIQTNKIVKENVTVKSIIDNYITATGGNENMKAVNTITEFSESNNDGGKSIYGYGKSLIESTYKGKQYKSVFNGISGYSGFNGEKKPFSQEDILRNQKYQPFSILGLDQSTLTVGKIETIKGVDCYTIIEPSTQSGSSKSTVTKYFEVKSGLYRGYKIEFSSSNSNYNSTSYSFYNDFREVDHIIFPFLTIHFSTGDKNNVRKSIVKEIKINEPNISFE